MGVYQGRKTQEISFPLGGIGTGSIGFAGNGRLVDWEIFNRPAKGSFNGYSHLAIRAEKGGRVLDARMLHGDLLNGYMGQYGKKYGLGATIDTMAGFPHFRQSRFIGEFPIAALELQDAHFPGKACVTAFNPLIPLDDKNSSLPAAFFEVAVENTMPADLDYTVSFVVKNPFPQSVNRLCDAGPAGVFLRGAECSPDDKAYGDMTVATDCADTAVQVYLYRGLWQDMTVTYWREFTELAQLPARVYDQPGEADHCCVFAKIPVPAGQTGRVRFVLAWNVPNQYNYWAPYQDGQGNDVLWKNYYATLFADSQQTAAYCLRHWADLYRRTRQFHDALFDSSLPAEVVDAASATLSVLKSPTVLRLEDGSFYGWEGVNETTGSCEGTCQHVWNYAYALPFLFPKLERSIRELEFGYTLQADGKMAFRLLLPLRKTDTKFRACVDGQMGAVIKTYREWKICGDGAWLKRLWPSVKQALEYAWSPENADGWDADQDGVLEGRQHHTLDMELFGPSSWLEGFYLAALKCGAEMADFAGEPEAAAHYRELYRKGSAFLEEQLFNGRYYIQKIDLKDRSVLTPYHKEDGYWFERSDSYWNEEKGEIKYQIGEGCIIDQMLAQWHAGLVGLGDIFDPHNRRVALQNLVRENFKERLGDFANPWRVFGLNDESGTVICSYPPDAYKPIIPVPYCEETMHGFEYALAGLCLQEGLVDEGLRLTRAVRDRYDGEKRNPWNEMECGSNYARSMASWALIPILGGFSYDMPHCRMGFCPVMPGDFRSVWSLDGGWGRVEITKERLRLTVIEGEIALEAFDFACADAKALAIDGQAVPFACDGGRWTFARTAVRRELDLQFA